MRTLVVVPTFQEVENIADVLTQLRAAVPDAGILVVDDASPDGTADAAAAAGRELGAVDLLRRPAKTGLGSAYRAGFGWGLERGAEVLVEIDADLSHDPSVLPELLAAVEEGADLAIGSRYVPGGSVPGWPTSRRLLSQWGNRYVGAMLDLGVADATAGYRAYRSQCLRQVDLSGVRADGYGFQIEMTYEIHRLGGVIVERPITFRDRARGTSKMSGSIVFEALGLVTLWGIRDRLLSLRGRPGRRRRR